MTAGEMSSWSDGTDVAEIYIRARVRNTGRRTAKGALVFLTSLEEVHTSGNTPTSLHDSMPLAWAGWTFMPRDIPPAPGVRLCGPDEGLKAPAGVVALRGKTVREPSRSEKLLGNITASS
jgi:hypothetical protein